MVIYSPLRYPGGKRKLVPYVKKLIKENSLYDCVYVEPYAGGASVALSLLIDGYVSKIVINDIDRSIFAFWYSIFNETEEFCRLIGKTQVNLTTWRKQREKQKFKDKLSLLELGFSTFFLNRTNYSGVIKGGVIGGMKQKGKWKINARYNKAELIARIKEIAQYRNSVELYNVDASKIIDTIKKRFNNRILIYFDPPYYNKGKNLYLNYYTDRDHQALFNQIEKLQNLNWLLTYDNVPEIKKLYSNYKQITYTLRYTANKSTIGQEVLILSRSVHSLKFGS